MKKKQQGRKPQIVSEPPTRSLKANTQSTANFSKSIRTEKPFPLPPSVRTLLHQLNDAGHVAYIVGGSVRDFLLGREIKDHDVATSADPDELCRLFPHAITVGKAFGVIKVPVADGSQLVEIATFRQDLEYHDHRHPKGVIFSGPVQDAQRRDFTINGLFYDPKTSRILDAVGGIDDLQNGIIRAIGNPNERFREDALRLLRAVRFMTRFGFRLDQHTADAIQARARLIGKISPERIRDELTLMWTGPNPADSLRLLSELSLLSFILPEVESIQGVAQIPSFRPDEDVWFHVLKTLDCLSKQQPSRSNTLSWMAVLHEIGKPLAARASGGKNFNGHEIESAKLAEKIATRLKMSRYEIDRIRAMVEDHLKFREVFQMRESTLQRFIREPHFEELLAFHKADVTASDGNLAFYEFCSSRLENLKTSPHQGVVRLVDGKDLIQLGFQPGPEFSEILRLVEDLSLEKKLKSKEDALEYVVKNFVR